MYFQYIRAKFHTLSVPAQACLLLLLAALLRLLLTLGSSAVLWPDSFAYYRSAALMAKQGNYVWHEIYRTPLYPFFLSIFLSFGESQAIGNLIILAQRCLGLGAVLFFFLSARRLFPPLVAFAASLLFSAHTLQLYYETVVQTEVLFIFLLSVLLYLTLNLLDKRTIPCAIALGLCAGLLTLARPIGQPVLLLALCALALELKNIRRFLVLAAITLCSCFVLLLPWMLVNKQHYKFFGVSQDLGLNLFHRVIDVEGLEPPAESKYPMVREIWKKVEAQPGVTYFKVYHSLIRKKVKPFAADRMLSQVALEALWANPSSFPWTSLRMFGELFLSPRKSVFLCPTDTGPLLCVPKRLSKQLPAFSGPPQNLSPSVQRIIDWYFRHVELPMGLISVLAFLGMLRWGKQKGFEPRFLFLLGLVLFFTGISALLNVPEDRFRLPIDAILLMFAIEALRQSAQKLELLITSKGASLS